MFEREIAEQWGVKPEGHPWLKPVRFHDCYRPAHELWPIEAGSTREPCVTDFFRIEGDQIHQVAVGPVHAGVIEPGHFRFQCHGENVFHLEISLGYQHRGIERALIGGPHKRTIYHMEAAAGDTTIGHTLAYSRLIEGLLGLHISNRAERIRAVALELERLANHTGDLGALAQDVGFLPTSSYCGRIRGDYLNLTALICGSRLGRGLIVPGGARFDLDEDRKSRLLDGLRTTHAYARNAINLLWERPSVMARFEHTGVVSLEDSESLGLVGPAARACGAVRDIRQDFPGGQYAKQPIQIAKASTGCVHARALVRWLESKHSVSFITEALMDLPKEGILHPEAKEHPTNLPAQSFTVSLVEGWRGEICHSLITDSTGRIRSYKIVDPSFHNWTGLAVALRGQQISDFPLCNKSFNLSYCGFDL
jgi:Ni,Fe-hydrogenase III large subunit